MQKILAEHFHIRVEIDEIEELISTLDNSCLLENVHFQEAQAEAIKAYRAASHRKPLLAGNSYPEHPDSLRKSLDEYLQNIASIAPVSLNGNSPDHFLHGVISPHIDYLRGGNVYAQTWKCAQQLAQEADLAIILGTDHYGASETPTLTRQNYATPYGVLPTAVDIVDALAEVIGPEQAFSGELRHIGEHSVELSSVWLHHMRQGKPYEILPILCGSFERYTFGEGIPESDTPTNHFIDTILEMTKDKRVLVVASADLSHVGPAFDGDPLDDTGKAVVQTADTVLLDNICQGDAQGFFAANKKDKDQYNVCGLVPIYMALRLLGGQTGELVSYEQCPADDVNTSIVSVCGVVF
ncbi:MAG: AmmeMemoRadiSam system protein B [Anaerolineales bacterium]|nr:AmmeMemoRadiSam system protein B [Anaerolineales bacterium]